MGKPQQHSLRESHTVGIRNPFRFNAVQNSFVTLYPRQLREFIRSMRNLRAFDVIYDCNRIVMVLFGGDTSCKQKSFMV